MEGKADAASGRDGVEKGSVSKQRLLLGELSEEERKRALERFALLQPCLEEGVSLAEVARTQKVSLKNVQRWVQRYRREGLVGLARRRRSDRGKRRGVPLECVHLIEGLALERPKRSVAEIHRRITHIALQKGWASLSYGRVYDIIQALDDELVVLAHEGSRAYQEQFDVLFLHEVSRPNERWQADHCWLNIWVVNEQGKPARPYLTIILDEYSRAVMGYRLSFDRPSALQTSLTLRQAIWSKHDARWPVCGIPDAFYTDHGSDFTSKHVEQVAAHLSMRLIFSQPGRPRGRGKIERFFRTVREMVLPGLPGYIPRVKRSYRSARKRQRRSVAIANRSERYATLTLAEFEERFRAWVVESYHHRKQRRLKGSPLECWHHGARLPRLPESLGDLDLLLLREVQSRQVHQEGIFFHGFRYMDPKLMGYVGETVVVYYDPLDVATIAVYRKESLSEERFLCHARCQDVSEQTVSLKEVVAARNAQRKKLRAYLDVCHREVAQASAYLQSPTGLPVSNDDAPTSKKTASPRSQFVPPLFMVQMAPEFLPEEEGAL